MRTALPAAVAFVVTAALLLSGCTPQTPLVVPPSEPAVEPVFASDEEALEAATEAYRAYLTVSDQIGHDGGKGAERLSPYVTEEWLSKEVSSFEAMAKDRVRQVGDSTFDSVTLQEHREDQDGAYVTFYTCLDLSGASLVAADGSKVVGADSKRWAFEVSFVRKLADDSALILMGHEPWSGADYCL